MKRIDIIYDELTLRYLYELNDLAVIWVQLVGGEKRPTRSWAHFTTLHEKQSPEERLETALEWLRKGYGLGFLPRNGLWVLDCDSPETTLRADEFLQDGFLTPIRVNTPSRWSPFLFPVSRRFQHGQAQEPCVPPERRGRRQRSPGTSSLGTGPCWLRRVPKLQRASTCLQRPGFHSPG